MSDTQTPEDLIKRMAAQLAELTRRVAALEEHYRGHGHMGKGPGSLLDKP